MTQEIQTVSKSREVEYTPFGAADKIKLSVEIIQKYVAAPSKGGKLPDERECIQFMMLARNRRLDPFAGDAFLIGYEDRDGNVKWSLVTSHVAFLKRAEASVEFDGMQSGVIVRDKDGTVIDREGDFIFDDDKLLGAWAKVYVKNRSHPTHRRLKLQNFQKPYGQWSANGAGMIVKCAEADALRSTFPNVLGGLYTEAEGAPSITVESSVVAKAPDFSRLAGQHQISVPKQNTTPASINPVVLNPPETAPEATSDKVTQEPPKEQGEPLESQGKPFKADSRESEELQAVRTLMQESGVSEGQVMAFCLKNKMSKEDQRKLSDLSNAKLTVLGKAWAQKVAEIKA